MKLFCFLFLLGFGTVCNGFSILDYIFGRNRAPAPDWNALKVTWTMNPFSGFNSLPRTIAEAADDHFTMVSDCGDHPSFNGKRYVKRGDYAVVLLYDVNGYIAGIQIGVSASPGFPPAKQINHPFVQDGDKYFLTAYFTNPGSICTTGRSADNYARNGTGDSLFIQNGTDPSPANLMTIPMTESAVRQTSWRRGHCFISMGDHYWYNVRADMSCDDFFPVFLLYNREKLNAFGWAMGTSMTSRRMEHPPHAVIGQFMNPVPRCLSDVPEMSTLHIFFTSRPRLFNMC